MLSVEVAFISYDPKAQLAIVFLRERSESAAEAEGRDEGSDSPSHRLLPIWIGLAEAGAIYTKLEGKESPRPMTHDLLATVVSTLGARVETVVVHSLEEMVFHGRIVLDVNGERMEIDARPSDAIALALRTDAAIFVEARVMDESAISESDIRDVDRSKDMLRDALESLDDDSYVKV